MAKALQIYHTRNQTTHCSIEVLRTLSPLEVLLLLLTVMEGMLALLEGI